METKDRGQDIGSKQLREGIAHTNTIQSVRTGSGLAKSTFDAPVKQSINLEGTPCLEKTYRSMTRLMIDMDKGPFYIRKGLDFIL
jgi:hypothetical protein